MRMHIFHMTFQSNELENDTLPKWHIHTSDNRIERHKKTPTTTKKTNTPESPTHKQTKNPPKK